MHHSNPRPKHASLAVLLALATAPLTASTAQPKATVKDDELAEVVVRGTIETGGLYQPSISTSALKTSVPLLDIPVTINVITKETFRDQGARSLNDALHSVPGVSVLAGDGARDQVYIRGFNAQNDNYVDGFRDDATYYRDLANIETIEVLKGPAAALYGRGSSGGIINRITRKPVFEDFYGVGGTGGSYGVKRGEVDVNHALSDTMAFRLSASGEDSGSFRDQYFLERYLLAPSLLFKPSGKTSVLVQLDYLNDRRLDDLGVPAQFGAPIDVPRSRYYGSLNGRKDDYIFTISRGGTVRLDHEFSNGLTLRNTLRASGIHQDRFDTRAPSFNVTQFGRQHTQIHRRDSGIFDQTDLLMKSSAWGLKHDLLAGLELNRQDKGSWGSRFNVANVDKYNPVLTAIAYGTATTPTFANWNTRWFTPLPGGTNLSSVSNTNHLTKTVGAYAQDLISIGAGWKVLAGFRYDHFDQATENLMLVPTNPNRTISRADSTWSTRAGIVYQPNNYTSLYTSISRSYQPSGDIGALSVSNKDLAPEHTQNHEVGAKMDLLDGHVSAMASVFRLEKSNIKVPDPVNAGQLLRVGEQRTDGLEFSVSGRPADGWDIIAAYTYLDAVVTRSTATASSACSAAGGAANAALCASIPSNVPLQGKRVPMVAKNSANLWLTKRFASGFGLGGSTTYTGKRFGSAIEQSFLPSYTRLDATAFYEVKTFEVRLNVYNVFDKHYTDAATGGNENAAIPGVPLSALLSAKFRF
jgi:catecholate siderophore receptor